MLHKPNISDDEEKMSGYEADNSGSDDERFAAFNDSDEAYFEEQKKARQAKKKKQGEENKIVKANTFLNTLSNQNPINNFLKIPLQFLPGAFRQQSSASSQQANQSIIKEETEAEVDTKMNPDYSSRRASK